jgi:hypothetical protein
LSFPIIEMKIERKLFWRWLSHIATIAAALLWSQKFNGHTQGPIPHDSLYNLYIYMHFC